MVTKRVIVRPYDEAWAQNFMEISAEIRAALGELALRIEHVGSTSVRGLSAKPIIDLDVVIRDDSVFETVVSRLQAIGYRHEGDLGIPGREAFAYEGKDHLQKHHLYVCPADSAELKRHLAFRDYLRAHPEAAVEYSRVKEEGAKRYPEDIDRYIAFKAPFIEEIMGRIGACTRPCAAVSPGKGDSSMLTEEIREELFRLQDRAYGAFQRKLIPTVDPDTLIGVRTPDLRRYARQLAKREEITAFLEDLPHRYFHENQLHAFILSESKDYTWCAAEVSRFLPYVDNWATCDQLSPRVFRKHRPELLEKIREWISAEETYTVRFAIGMLMEHFLVEDFDPAYPELVANLRSEEYYVNMMIAWYFATALAKQYEAIIPYIEKCRLSLWTHNKAIQKSVESNRIPAERKEYLKSLRGKKPDRPNGAQMSGRGTDDR